MKLRHLAVGIAALLLTSGLALAAGLFPGFPIVGGAAYCNTYSTGTNGQFCTNNTPAGPSLTGNELIPADTQLSQGQQPQTVLIPSVSLGGGAIDYETPLTGASLTVAPSTGKLLLKPAGTIATLTVTLPAAAALKDGQRLSISSTQTVTALTLTAGSGTTVNNSPSAITVSTTAPYGYEFIYRAADTSWYRLQ